MMLRLTSIVTTSRWPAGGGRGRRAGQVYNKGRAASKGKRSCKHEMQAEAGRLAHTGLNG